MDVKVRLPGFDKEPKKIDSKDIEAFSYPQYESGYSMLIYYDVETCKIEVIEIDGGLEDLGQSYFAAIALELIKSPVGKELLLKVINDTSMDEETKEKALYSLSLLPCLCGDYIKSIEDLGGKIKEFKEQYFREETK